MKNNNQISKEVKPFFMNQGYVLWNVILIIIYTTLISSCAQNPTQDEPNNVQIDSVEKAPSYSVETALVNKQDSMDLFNKVKIECITFPLSVIDSGINNLQLGVSLIDICCKQGLLEKDTTMEDEASWPGKAVFRNGELLFVAEASWQERARVNRFTIISDKIRTKDQMYVGVPFSRLKTYVSQDIPSAPDGYIILKDKRNSNLYYELDTDGLTEKDNLYYGADLAKIPPDMRVKYILVM